MAKSVLLLVMCVCGQSAVSARDGRTLTTQYQNIQPQNPPAIKPKQTVQQFQISVILPPGAQKPAQGAQAPNPPVPEYVWLQLPASYFPSQVPQVPSENPTQAPVLVQPSLPVSSTPTAEGGLFLKKCLKLRGQFPSDSCNKYVNCWDGVAVEQFCPEGLLFNPRGYCDYPQNVNCGGRPVEATPPPLSPTNPVPGQTPSEAPPTSVAPPTVVVTLPTIDPSLRKLCLKPRGQFRSTICNKYVNCWDDVVIEQECPDGLLFSNKGYCDYPANVDCKNLSAPPRSGSEISNECPAVLGTFRDASNCSNYFTCIGGNIVARYSCPEGFKFNDNIGVCDYEERVDCASPPLILTTKSNFLTNISRDAVDKIYNCEPGTVFALNPQCTAACLCRDGVSEVVQCPSGLAYDKGTDKCVLPQIAKC